MRSPAQREAQAERINDLARGIYLDNGIVTIRDRYYVWRGAYGDPINPALLTSPVLIASLVDERGTGRYAPATPDLPTTEGERP